MTDSNDHAGSSFSSLQGSQYARVFNAASRTASGTMYFTVSKGWTTSGLAEVCFIHCDAFLKHFHFDPHLFSDCLCTSPLSRESLPPRQTLQNPWRQSCCSLMAMLIQCDQGFAACALHVTRSSFQRLRPLCTARVGSGPEVGGGAKLLNIKAIQAFLRLYSRMLLCTNG